MPNDPLQTGGPAMSDTQALQRLIEAVERGEWVDTWSQLDRAGVAHGSYGALDGGYASLAFNGSLDAAKDLHKALLPGWCVRINAFALLTSKSKGSAPYVHIFKPRHSEDDEPMSGNSSGYKVDCIARAWLLAILRAMLAEREGGQS